MQPGVHIVRSGAHVLHGILWVDAIINNYKSMLGLGARELVILAVILVLLFGAKKIPELAKAIGDAVRHIKGGFSDDVKDSGSDKPSAS
jgi:sec-independent protein translocase protein TatA